MTTTPGLTFGYLTIKYNIPKAAQKSYHPTPTHFHPSTERTAYLPDTPEGQNILLRFQYAFLHGLCFGVGQSLTSGLSDQVTWSYRLPHKTRTVGGPLTFGFPDPSYLPKASRALDLLDVPSDPQICRQWILQNKNETIRYDADAAGGSSIDRYNKFLEPVVNNDNSEVANECSICLEKMVLSSSPDATNVVCLKNCKHRYHKSCIIAAMKQKYTKCPYCREPIGIHLHGPGPSGELEIKIDYSIRCRGSEQNSDGVIILHYTMPGGTQTAYMENPGHKYYGTIRKAYLPHNDPGRALLQRLKYAFSHGMTFRVGTSVTTGRSNRITWTSIHHKTSLNYGEHGYPDKEYFSNCNGALDALRVPKAEDCS